MHQKVIKYGSTKNLNKKKDHLIQKILMKKQWFILMPDGQFKKYWDIIIVFLLFYVAILMPFNVCFIRAIPGAGMTTQDKFDIGIDFLFGVDIIVNFISAYEDENTGIPVIDPKRITSNYVGSWFIFDLVAIFPFALLE
jgi:potassium voltage-gated channel Eag-related subfamily H member 8